jgi:hypothetical protein
MKIHDRDERFLRIFEIFRLMIISVSAAKLGWLDSEKGNSIVLEIGNVSLFNKLKLSFSVPIESNKLHLIGRGADGDINLDKCVETNNLQDFLIDTVHLDGVKSLVVRHDYSLWPAWQLHSYKIVAIGNSSDSRETEILFESMGVLTKIVDIIEYLHALGLPEREYIYLKELTDGAEFSADWRNTEDKTLALFNDVANAISPYTMSAHGVTLPIAMQGSDKLIGDLPITLDLLNALEVPWFCTSGTLLGFVRDGKLIDYDDDMDFVVYLGLANDSDQVKELITKFSEKNSNKVTKGINSLHYRLNGVRASTDIFVSWGNSKGEMFVYPWCAADLSYDDFFPLGRIVLNGAVLNTPANSERALLLNYGEAWRTPDPLWRFDWAKSNSLFHDFFIK